MTADDNHSPGEGPARTVTTGTGKIAQPQPVVGLTIPAGTRISGIFEIEKQIGAGGMGMVYRAHNIETGDAVAIKIVRAELAGNEQVIALFRKEAAVLHKLFHDAIVRYYIFGSDQAIGRQYLATEFVDGTPLSDIITAGPLERDDAIDLAERLADGLAAAHAVPIFHRDISPDNIILPGSDVRRAKIIDFGIARAATIGGGTVIGDSIAGKFDYMSPEQLGLFGAQVDARSDIYSLGIVLAEAFLGRSLKMGGTQLEVVEKRRKVPDLTGVEPGLKALLTAMTQPKPDDRIASMADVAAEARALRSGKGARGSAGSSRVPAFLGLVALLAAGGAGYLYLTSGEEGAGVEQIAGVTGDAAPDTTAPQASAPDLTRTDLTEDAVPSGAGVAQDPVPAPTSENDDRATVDQGATGTNASGDGPDESTDPAGATAVANISPETVPEIGDAPPPGGDRDPLGEPSGLPPASHEPEPPSDGSLGSAVSPGETGELAAPTQPPALPGGALPGDGTAEDATNAVDGTTPAFSPAGADPIGETGELAPNRPPSDDPAFPDGTPIGPGGEQTAGGAPSAGDPDPAVADPELPSPELTDPGQTDPAQSDTLGGPPGGDPSAAPLPSGDEEPDESGRTEIATVDPLGAGTDPVVPGTVVDPIIDPAEDPPEDAGTFSVPGGDTSLPNEDLPPVIGAVDPSFVVPPADPATAVAFVSDADLGPCTYMRVSEASEGRTAIDAYGATIPPFAQFDNAFKGSMGYEASINLRLVAEGQCPAIELASNLSKRGASTLEFQLTQDVIAPGDVLSGTVTGLGGRDVKVLLVGSDGRLYDLREMVSKGEDDATLFTVMSGSSGEFPGHILLAIAGDELPGPINTPGATSADLEEIREAVANQPTADVALAYFKYDN